MPKTRFVCPVFGAPKTFKYNVLPTYADVIKYYLFLRSEIMENTKKEPSLSVVYEKLIRDVKLLWEKSSISVVSDQQILHQIKTYYKKFRAIKKRVKNDGKMNSSKTITDFREAGEKKLFDISICKCKDFFPVFAS